MPQHSAPLPGQRALWLKQTKAFAEVYRRGFWAHGPSLSVGVLKRPGEPTRIGLRTRRGLKGAVIRNRLKRQIRGLIRSNQASLKPAWDAVIVIHPRNLPVTTITLAEELKKVCKRAGLLS